MKQTRRQRRIVMALVGIAMLIGGAGLWFRFQSFSTRTVIDGAFYRSSQPDAADLRSMAQRLGIRSVVNLRGSKPEEQWYRDEIAASESLGLEHHDFHFRNVLSDWPQRYVTRDLVHFLESAPRPVLIHCLAGADRAGWASGIVRALAGEPLPAVRRALSPLRGHVCSSDCRLDRFFDQYTNWLADEGRAHAGAAFREWVLEHYAPGPYAATVELVAGPSRTRFAPGEPLRYRLRVSNLSSEPWTLSSDGTRGIRFGARILGPLHASPERAVDLFRVPNVPAIDLLRIAPSGVVIERGQRWETDVELQLPKTAGRYLLQFDMVDEYVHWFSDLGGPGLILELEIEG